MGAAKKVPGSGLLLGEQWVEAEGGREFTRTDPYTGVIVSRAAAASVGDVKKIAEAAEVAFSGWASISGEERARILRATAHQLLSRADELAEIALVETGAPIMAGHLHIGMAVENLRWAAGQVHALEGRTIPSSKPGRTSLTLREPAGPVLVMAPWNGAIFQMVRSAVLPLALGNPVVLRGSELSPRSHAAVAEAFVAAGAPPGVVGFLTSDPRDSPAVVGALISHPAIRGVSFTGSDRVGSVIASLAASYFKPVVMELGDSSPCIVLADANLDDAVAAVALGGFAYSGQGCISTERLLVDHRVLDDFTNRLVAVVASFTTGDPRAPGTMLPPLIVPAAVDRVHALVSEAVGAGARVLCGGQPDGAFYPATVVTGVQPDMRIFQEETFGPVVTITAIDGPDQAVRLANDSPYGLSSAVFTGDIELGMAMARRIRTGMCHINGTTLDDETPVPFGGTKRSGMGRHGLEGAIAAFTEVKWITIEPAGAHTFQLFGIPLGLGAEAVGT